MVQLAVWIGAGGRAAVDEAIVDGAVVTRGADCEDGPAGTEIFAVAVAVNANLRLTQLGTSVGWYVDAMPSVILVGEAVKIHAAEIAAPWTVE